MTPVLALLTPVLAQEQPPPNAPEFGGSSPIGLVVIVLLFIAMFFLIRSMNTHLRKVPPSFDQHELDKPDDAEQRDSAENGGGDGPKTTEAGTDGEQRDGRS